MVRDERPGYPMVFPVVLEFQGRIDRSAMEQAFRDVLSYEPLLTARLARRGRYLYWINSKQMPMLVWEDGAEPPHDNLSDVSVRPGHVFDLTEEPGLRAQVSVFSTRVTLTCYFHHACTDGLGAFQFIANWLACYGRIIGDDEGLDADLPRPGLASRRADLGIVLPEPLTSGQITRAALIESYRWLAHRPRPLATGNHKASTTSVAPVVMLKRLDSELVGKLRAYTTHKEVRLNDLLLRDMFLTIRDWNSSFQPVKERQHVRILMPTNLRKRMHRGMPAANLLGYGFLTRKISDCHRPDELLYGIRDEVKYIRDWSLGAVFLHGVGIFRRIPYALQLLTSKRFCHATCVVSNLGPMLKTLAQKRFRRRPTIP